HGQGPAVCLHLMSLISLLDKHTALVDLPWLAVETVELLQSRGFNFIAIDESERDTLACNVLALGGNRLLAIEENRKTNARLRACSLPPERGHGAHSCIRTQAIRQSLAAHPVATPGRAPTDLRSQRQPRRRGLRPRPPGFLRAHWSLRSRFRRRPARPRRASFPEPFPPPRASGRARHRVVEDRSRHGLHSGLPRRRDG